MYLSNPSMKARLAIILKKKINKRVLQNGIALKEVNTLSAILLLYCNRKELFSDCVANFSVGIRTLEKMVLADLNLVNSALKVSKLIMMVFRVIKKC
jgi:hypothetical protein